MVNKKLINFVKSFETTHRDAEAVINGDGSGAIYVEVAEHGAQREPIVWWDDKEGLENLITARMYV